MSTLWCCWSITGMDTYQECLQVLVLHQVLQELWSPGGVPNSPQEVEFASLPPVPPGARGRRHCWLWVQCPAGIAGAASEAFKASSGQEQITSPVKTQNRWIWRLRRAFRGCVRRKGLLVLVLVSAMLHQRRSRRTLSQGLVPLSAMQES